MDKKFYVCEGCHKAVNCGNVGAVRDAIAIYESCEENGYLVNVVGNGFFSNRYYIIFEDCNLDLADEDYRKFVHFNENLDTVKPYAERHLKESFNDGFQPAKIDAINLVVGKVWILGGCFNLYYMRFILKYFGVESMAFEVKLDDVGQLFIRAGSHKAILMAIRTVVQ